MVVSARTDGTKRAEAATAESGRVGQLRPAAKGLWTTRNLVRIAMLGALAFGLMYAEFNLPYFPVFLQYDPGDVPTMLGGFAMGPVGGAAVALVKGVLFLLSGKDEAGVLGTAANLATSLSFVLVAAAVYWRVHTKKGAIASLGAGLGAMVVTMAFLNYYVFLPAYGIPAEALGATVKTVILFNLVKGTLNSVITFLVYKKVSPLLHG